MAKEFEKEIKESLFEKLAKPSGFNVTDDTDKTQTSPYITPSETPVIPLHPDLPVCAPHLTEPCEMTDSYLDELEVLTALLKTMSRVILANETVDTIEKRIRQLINDKITNHKHV